LGGFWAGEEFSGGFLGVFFCDGEKEDSMETHSEG